MGLIARQFLICLVIIGNQHLFVISSNAPRPYPVPARCESDYDCLIGKAKCIRRECHCTGKYIYGNGKTQCERWTKCSLDAICLFWNVDNTNTICLKHPKYMTTTCKCESGYFGRASLPRCMNAAKKNGKYPCLANMNCPKYSKCHEGWCKCADELIGDGENCRPAPAHPCKKNEDCNERATCHRGKCRCAKDTTGNGKYCRDSLPCPKKYAEECKAGVNNIVACIVDPYFPDVIKCKCRLDYKGSNDGTCVEMTECEKNDLMCPTGMDCKTNETDYWCDCKDGYKKILYGAGKTACKAPAHPCEKNEDCHKKAKCHRGKCRCNGKTTGNGKYCRDSLACPRKDEKKCRAGGYNVISCVVDPLFPDLPECKCRLDFKTSEAGICVKMTECEKNDLVCPTGKVCKTNKTDYWCECRDGYEEIGRGAVCRELPHPCKKNDDCNERAACYRGKCQCVGKTTGSGKKCRDSLPCPKEYVEKCKAGGSNVVACVVDPLFPDLPECKCHVGFKTSEAGICVEITECEKNDLVCPTGKVCKTNKGNYWCDCKDGYDVILLGAEETTCKDIDECSQKACSAIENSVCTNIEGGYKCECKEGFRKNADQSTCEALANQICQEGVCKCSPGFAKNSDEECIDVDECSQDDTPCGAYEECLNDQGTYSCVCRSGYKKRNKVCTKEEECNCKRDEVCEKGKCKCKKGYKKSTKGYCVPRRRFTQTAQAGLGLSLHGNGFLSTFLLGVLGAWLSQST